jgi:formylglycine-generating enzyme required for sulfatase activity
MSFAALALVGGGLFLVLALSAVAAPSAGSTAGSPANERQGEMIAIPACDFTMGGTDANAFDNEKPVGKVFVAAFHMGKYEVTNAQFAAFLNANGGWTKDDSGNNWVHASDPWFQLVQGAGRWKPKAGKEHHPVVDVTWFGATAYAKWAGARLPTEAEWEKAARGTDGRTYPWGSEWAWSKGNFGGQIAAVGSFPGDKSPYGCMDMGGNVCEWVSSKYSPYPYRSDDGREDLSDKTAHRVYRGGYFYLSIAWYARAALRSVYVPSDWLAYLGFRLART